MNLSAKVLGQTAVTRLSASTVEHILVIGSDKLTRSDLADRDCYNFVAARNLTTQLKPLKIKSLQDLFDNWPPRELALPHVGVVSLAVLGAAFEKLKIGGSNPLEAWVKKHQQKIVTFDSVKTRVRKEEATAA